MLHIRRYLDPAGYGCDLCGVNVYTGEALIHQSGCPAETIREPWRYFDRRWPSMPPIGVATSSTSGTSPVTMTTAPVRAVPKQFIDRRFACSSCGADGYEYHKPTCPMAGGIYWPGLGLSGICIDCGRKAMDEGHDTVPRCRYHFLRGCCGTPHHDQHRNWCDFKSPRNPVCDHCGAVRNPETGELAHDPSCVSIPMVTLGPAAPINCDHCGCDMRDPSPMHSEWCPNTEGRSAAIGSLTPTGPLPEKEAVDLFLAWLDGELAEHDRISKHNSGPNGVEAHKGYYGGEALKAVRKKFNDIFVTGDVPW